MKQYDPQTLNRLHRFTLTMLRDFLEVCEKYDIPCFAVYGTALGAVRHHGFIPWDDDLDMAMLREDYERFLEVMPAELGDRYILLNSGWEEGYTCSVNHFGRKGTVFVSEQCRHMKCEQRICFDIFVYDEVPEDAGRRKRQFLKGTIWSKLLYLKGTAHPSMSLRGVKRALALTACAILHGILILCRVKTRTLYQKEERNATRYRGSGSPLIACFQCSNIPRTLLRKDDVFPLKAMPFEGLTLNVPGEIDRFLTNLYGDYRKLPKEEDRTNHFPYRLDFGGLDDAEHD